MSVYSSQKVSTIRQEPEMLSSLMEGREDVNDSNMKDFNKQILHSWSGWQFRIHSPTEGGTCDSYRRNVAWSYSNVHNSLESHVPRCDWSLVSSVMLEITYRPAYQALPKFTSTPNCFKRFAQQTLSKMCCLQPSRKVHFVREIYSYGDIDKVNRLSSDIFIKGVGACVALEVILIAKKRGKWPNSNGAYIAENPSVIFALPKVSSKINDNIQISTCPPILWKATVPKDDLIAIESVTIFDGNLDLPSGNVGPSHIYCHGYQSWSFAGSVSKGKRRPNSAMPRFVSKAFNRGGKFPPPGVISRSSEHENSSVSKSRRPTFYKSEFFTCLTHRDQPCFSSQLGCDERILDENGGNAVLMGWLSQKYQFGIVGVDKALHYIEMHCNCDAMISKSAIDTDWAYGQILLRGSYFDEPMATYLESVARHCEARIVREPLSVGWCSWYHYYEKIDEYTLRENFQLMANINDKIPTNMAIIDDGYMVSWGDWEHFKRGKFSPDSMKRLAKTMKDNGMRPGLWLAPFACDKNSKLAKDHPDWIIKNNEGSAANSANCGKFFFGLDVTNPAVRQHAYNIVKKAVDEWGFEVLKLDFLYAAVLVGNGKHDLSMSRAEAMNVALQSLRKAAGNETFILACGAPIGSSIGIADGMRISADTAGTWKPQFPLPWWDWSTLPCLFAMIRNNLTRMPFGYRWWHNDPDCLLLGKSTSLTIQEVKSAATIIALSGGMLLLSDDLPALDEGRLQIVRKLYPVTGVTAIPLDMHASDEILPTMLRVICSDEEPSSYQEHSFMNEKVAAQLSRNRNSITMAKGLGKWGCISISNWKNRNVTASIPMSSFQILGDEAECVTPHGFHAFSFWSQSYVWLSSQNSSTDRTQRSISKNLGPHESEIFHLKPVHNKVQFIGSDLHFSCGFEVDMMISDSDYTTIKMKKLTRQSGHIYVSVPLRQHQKIEVKTSGDLYTAHYMARVSLKDGGLLCPQLNIFVYRIPVTVNLNGCPEDGIVAIKVLS